MTTITELLAATVADLGIDVNTQPGRDCALQLARRLGQAAEVGRQQALDAAISACAGVYDQYEAQSNACNRRTHSRKGKVMTERATGAYMCVSTLKSRWRNGNDAIKTP